MFLKKKYICKVSYSVGTIFFWSFAIILTTILAGCYQPVEQAVIISSVPVGFDTFEQNCYVAGLSVENRSVQYCVLGEGRDVIFCSFFLLWLPVPSRALDFSLLLGLLELFFAIL